jgi:hypothetical protein
MVGRDPRPEKVRDFRKEPHGTRIMCACGVSWAPGPGGYERHTGIVAHRNYIARVTGRMSSDTPLALEDDKAGEE